MKKHLTILALGASILAAPAMAAPAGAQVGGDWTRAAAQAQAETRFAQMDVNKDGKFDAADRSARQAQRQEARFAALDANKDGSVSKAEWDQARAAREAKMAERRAEFSAKRAERAAAVAANPSAATEAKAKRGEHRFAGRGDRGGMRGHGMRGGRGLGTQAAVNQAEFVAKALTRFDALDADKNGTVTATERQAARATMREQRGKHRAAAVQPAK